MESAEESDDSNDVPQHSKHSHACINVYRRVLPDALGRYQQQIVEHHGYQSVSESDWVFFLEDKCQ